MGPGSRTRLLIMHGGQRPGNVAPARPTSTEPDMQPPIARRRPLPFDATAPLLRPAYALPPGGLPVFPPAWHVVPNARALVLRHEDGRILTVDAEDSIVDAKRVALMTLGTHRLSIHSDGERCEARWEGYRLAAPMTLADFMTVLLSLLWD